MPRSAHSESRAVLAALVLPLFAASGSGRYDISVNHERTGFAATIRGGRLEGIRYSITQRIAAASEKEARQAALSIAVTMERQSGSSRLTFPGSSQSVHLDVPRSASLLTVVSAAGDIDVAEIEGSIFTRNGAGRTILDRIGGNAEILTAGGATRLGLIG